MFWFVTYKGDDGEKRIEDFFSVEKLFEWLQGWNAKVGSYPKSLCVFKAECIFDGSV